MEEKFLGFYNFVAVAKTRCSGECLGRSPQKKLGIGRRTFHRTITEMNVWAETLRSETRIHHGRGTGVGRGRGVG